MKTVELDTTIADLYATHGVASPLVFDLYHNYTHIDLHVNFPRETAFVEDEDPNSYGNGGGSLRCFKKWALCFKTIRFLPVVGPAAVMLYLPDNDKDNIRRALEQIPESQRPKIEYVDLDDPHMEATRTSIMRDKRLIYWRPKAWMPKENCVVAPEVSYMVNDKRFLTHPDIPTPAIDTIQIERQDQRGSLASHPLPFVIKLCRCSGGQGIFLVTSEDARQKMLEAVIRYSERGGKEVQLWEFVRSDKPHYGANFFVGSSGSPGPQFLGASEQVTTETGAWVGGIIDYSAQEDLYRRLRDTISAVSHALKQVSYIGWVSIDVIFAHDNRPLVVDLNARLAGGIGLVPFSKHFLSQSLPLAQLLTLSFPGPASAIYNVLAARIDSGQVIVSFSAEVSDEESMASVVIGGRDRDDLRAVSRWIQDQLPTFVT